MTEPMTPTQADRDAFHAFLDDTRALGPSDPEEAFIAVFARYRHRPAWNFDMSAAPYSTPVRVKCGEMTFVARLLKDASMSDVDTSCDQWVAENEGEHPPCWSGGACWTFNEDNAASLPVSAWMPLPAAPGAA